MYNTRVSFNAALPFRIVFIFSVLLFVPFSIYLDLKEVGDGDVKAVSKALWNISDTSKIEKFSNNPDKYITLTKYIRNNPLIINTMIKEGWKPIDQNTFQGENGDVVWLEEQILWRHWTIIILNENSSWKNELVWEFGLDIYGRMI